jgi:shikimate dehydrogenase
MNSGSFELSISGQTRNFAVLGHPIGHSLSPAMHNASFRAMGLDAIYLAFDVHPDKLMDVLGSMAAMGFKGVNLTVPLKEVAHRGLTDLDPSARLLGAVNTVEFTDQGMRGHNTDGRGFLLAIHEAFSLSLKGRSVFIFGNGGAGRAVALTAAMEGASHLMLTDLDFSRTERLADEIAILAPGATVQRVRPEPAQWDAFCPQADLVVQSTPVGMKPTDASPLASKAFRPGQMMFDLVYMHPETTVMKAARAGGAKTANGLGMLLHQGAFAFNIWTGQKADTNAMRKALEQRVYGI